MKQILCQEIQVGEIVYCSDGEELPCDMVVLKTSTGSGTCYIQTASVDGETSLKQRFALPETCMFNRPTALLDLEAYSQSNGGRNPRFPRCGRVCSAKQEVC